MNQAVINGTNFLNKFLKSGAIVGLGGQKIKTQDGHHEFDHLLMINFQSDSEIKNALGELYPPYQLFLNRRSFGDHNQHEHIFGLINLISKKLLLIGIGRKCYPFFNDAESGKVVDWHVEKDISARAIFSSNTESINVLDEFFVGDNQKNARQFIEDIINIGAMIREREGLQLLPYEIEETAWAEGKERAKALEEFGLEESQFEEILEQYKNIDSSIEDSLSFINNYFPDLDESLINSDDFM